MNNRCAIYGDNYIFENAGNSENLSRARNIVRELVRSGVNTFVTECDSKYELGLASYIVQLKEKNPDVHLVVVRPFSGAISSSDSGGVLKMILGKADMVRDVAENKERFAQEKLDKWIISHCDTIMHVRNDSDTGETRLPSADLTGKRVISITSADLTGKRIISISESGKKTDYDAGWRDLGNRNTGGRDMGSHRMSNRDMGSYRMGNRDMGSRNNGIDLNEIVISAQQIPGRAKFDNYDELRSYLEKGLRQYNRTVYTLDNIEQARQDHFVLKTVKRKLTDVRRALKKGYTAPIDVVLEQLDELIGMVKEPFDNIDKLLKANARVIKEHDIMSYAGVQAVVLGKYSGSVLRSPAFFNPKWLNVSYKEAQWKSDVDTIIEKASADIKYIIANGENNTGAILGYYFDKLSLDGVENFLKNIMREDVPNGSQVSAPIFVDINTGEVISQEFGGNGPGGFGSGWNGSGGVGSGDSGIGGSELSVSDSQAVQSEGLAEGAIDAAGDTLVIADVSEIAGDAARGIAGIAGNSGISGNTSSPEINLYGNINGSGANISGAVNGAGNIEHRKVILSGNPAQIDKYINAARVFGVEVSIESKG